MKFGIILTILSLFLVFSFHFVNGEMSHESIKMDHDPTIDLLELLKNEDRSKFFSNQENGDFLENFVRKATMPPSNDILIKSGTTITLSGSIDREYSTILVEGNLKIIDTGDSSLRAQKIIVGPTGSLTIGNEKKPIQNDKQVEIVFINNREGEVGLFVFGNLWIHGKEVNPTFVGVENYAKKWEKKVFVAKKLVNWERDNTVVVTSPGKDQCNEIIKISKVFGKELFLQTQLNCSHIGDDSEDSIVSHVALLSRNVKFTSESEIKRGSVNFFHGSTGYIKYAHFDKLGPKEVLGRYPIHFHHMMDTSRGIEVIGNSITNSDNRWITIHDSNGILVKNNVGYKSVGHGYFLEDGNEFDNIFENNIGIETSRGSLITTDRGSSVFWTMNPSNVYRDNVAVNGQYWGFFFEIPNTEIEITETGEVINLRSLPSLEFDGNTAYNFRLGGMKILRPNFEQNGMSSPEILISNFKVMSSFTESKTHSGILVHGSNVTISNATLFNNKFGILLKGDWNKVEDTIIKKERNKKIDSEIFGVMIDGKNNLIQNSEISGYVSKNSNKAADISISNSEKQKRLLSAKIVNSTLLDPIPIYFGNPTNEKSFLEIYGYNAPHASTKKVPENFMLKKMGSEPIERRGEYNNLDFDAMVKLFPETNPKNLEKMNEETNNSSKTTNELIKKFKNQANAWAKNELENTKFLDEIEILIESRVFEIKGLEQDSFKDSQLVIPQWVKKLVSYWSDNSISDQEFINALKYVLEPKSEYTSTYG